MKFHNMLLVAASVLYFAASLSATKIEHTWVSGSGSDSNACTFALPCATFQGALANTSANGLITAKDAGDFGQVSINQSVTIDGSNLGSIAIGGGTVAIEIFSADNVILRNLTIDGLGSLYYGIEADNGGNLYIDNCTLENIPSQNIFFNGAGNLTVENSRIKAFGGSSTVNEVYGINLFSNGAENVVVKNTVIDASSSSYGNIGFFVEPGSGPVTASLQNVTINVGLTTGAYESYGVRVWSGVTEVTGSVITQNNVGVEAKYGATVSVASSQISANATGVCSQASSKIRLDNNDIYDNTTAAIANCGGIVKTSTTNKTSGTIAIPASDVSDSVTF